MLGFTPKSYKDIKDVVEGRAGEEANRYFRQATSYWEMISSLMMSGGLSQECVDLFTKTTREFFLCYAKLAPYLDQYRADTRPTAFQNLEQFCQSLPDYEKVLAFFTKMNAAISQRIATSRKASKKAGRSSKRKR